MNYFEGGIVCHLVLLKRIFVRKLASHTSILRQEQQSPQYGGLVITKVQCLVGDVPRFSHPRRTEDISVSANSLGVR
jgi:hypothetical protein